MDYKKSLKWAILASENKIVASYGMLSWHYTSGKGTPQNYLEAVKWAKLGAKKGDVFSQNLLSFFYHYGLGGLPQDRMYAHLWANLAAATGDKVAIQARDKLSKEMTFQEIAEAQRWASTWTPEVN